MQDIYSSEATLVSNKEVMDGLEANEETFDDPWDDSLLIKAYDDSIRLAREELARRVALSTSKDNAKGSTNCNKDINKEIMKDGSPNVEYKIGDYVRATYEDGVDYEAKITSIDPNSGTCFVKYIGYGNEQEVLLNSLIPSWGKNARRIQFAKAKLGEETDRTLNVGKNCSNASKKDSFYNLKTIPPPPPMPPMLCATQSSEDSEHLSAMLMSWYMSGYYTGVYQGIQMGKSASKGKN